MHLIRNYNSDQMRTFEVCASISINLCLLDASKERFQCLKLICKLDFVIYAGVVIMHVTHLTEDLFKYGEITMQFCNRITLLCGQSHLFFLFSFFFFSSCLWGWINWTSGAEDFRLFSKETWGAAMPFFRCLSRRFCSHWDVLSSWFSYPGRLLDIKQKMGVATLTTEPCIEISLRNT